MISQLLLSHCKPLSAPSKQPCEAQTQRHGRAQCGARQSKHGSVRASAAGILLVCQVDTRGEKIKEADLISGQSKLPRKLSPGGRWLGGRARAGEPRREPGSPPRAVLPDGAGRPGRAGAGPGRAGAGREAAGGGGGVAAGPGCHGEAGREAPPPQLLLPDTSPAAILCPRSRQRGFMTAVSERPPPLPATRPRLLSPFYLKEKYIYIFIYYFGRV